MKVIVLTFLGLLSISNISNAFGTGRIIGGSETTVEKLPYMASLQDAISGIIITHRCGASIISDRFLISSAQCHPQDIASYYARLGSTKYNEGGQFLQVASLRLHPEYSPGILDYDISIVGFAEGVRFNLGPTIAVVPLANVDPEDGSMMVVAGWGITQESSSFNSDVLVETELPVVNQDVCKRTYSFLTDRHICIGGLPEGGVGACARDVGGPAVFNGVQYGIISGGIGCVAPNTPSLYTRITEVREWIRGHTGV